MKQITVTVNGQSISAVSGLTLSEIVRGEKPCGGHGKCGKCKVIATGDLSPLTEAERDILSADELARHVRLACMTRALGDCAIITEAAEETAQIVTDGVLPEMEIQPTFSRYGVAMDIGTTTLAARLYDAAGKCLADASCINPQQAWGADVVSRIEAALGGKATDLATAIRTALHSMLAELAEGAAIEAQEIDGVVITGNTVMLSLLTAQSVEPFSHAPFAAERLFGETLSAKELDLSCLRADTPVYLPPCISAFVGADATCAILATRLCKGSTAMLADIGTNGEMALWQGGKLTVCSTAAGPAFEGVGISMGMRGAVGAIDRVRVEDDWLQAHVIGDVTPIGICGSGLVDAVACLLDLDILDEGGYLEYDTFTIQAPVSITPKDIRMLQLAKSAICAGLVTLLRSEGITSADVSTLYISGGFGSYLNKDSASRIGLVPAGLAARSTTVGNAALAGAAMLLLHKDMATEAKSVVAGATTLDLATNPIFSDQYMSGMMLEEVDD